MQQIPGFLFPVLMKLLNENSSDRYGNCWTHPAHCDELCLSAFSLTFVYGHSISFQFL